MSTKLLVSAAAAALLSFAAGAANATTYIANLSGANEVPPAATPGSGTALVTISGHWMAVDTSFSGLIGNTTASHIHCCQPLGTNAGVATQTPSFTGFPSGVTSGTYFHKFDLLDPATYRAGFVTANGGTAAGAMAALVNGIAAGQAYYNIHTSSFPGGEIRGQLAGVPEPGTWAMMILGVGLAGLALRRRRALA